MLPLQGVQKCTCTSQHLESMSSMDSLSCMSHREDDFLILYALHSTGGKQVLMMLQC